jgi:butyrate kinase
MAGENSVHNVSNPNPVIAPESVLVINPGSTSTKFGIFTRQGPEWVAAVKHDDAELEQFRGRSALAQAGYRAP